MYKAYLEKEAGRFNLYIRDEEGFTAFANYNIETSQIKTNEYNQLVIAVDVPVTSIEMIEE